MRYSSDGWIRIEGVGGHMAAFLHSFRCSLHHAGIFTDRWVERHSRVLTLIVNIFAMVIKQSHRSGFNDRACPHAAAKLLLWC